MMTSDDKVGGWVKKGQNHDDVILEWSLMLQKNDLMQQSPTPYAKNMYAMLSIKTPKSKFPSYLQECILLFFHQQKLLKVSVQVSSPKVW